MTVEIVNDLKGSWSGTSRLFLEGQEFGSDSTASIGLVGQGRFVSVAYTWEFDRQPQDGLIVFPLKSGNGAVTATWLDSWHMGESIMVCEATRTAEGEAALLGSFPAPPGPDWGWRIEIGASDGGALEIRMFIITPDGKEGPAVLGRYQRAGD